jgi:uncharacterized protein
MLRLRINDLSEDKRFYEFEEESESFPVLAQMAREGECRFLGPLKIRLEVQKIRDTIEVEGDLKMRVALSCSRCLKEYGTDLAIQFELTYVQESQHIPENTAEKEIELTAEEMGLVYFTGETIELREGIQEQAVLAFPIRPLCSEACQGLCPQCGANLNQGDCGCERRVPDSRFAVLKNLKLKRQGLS